MWSIEPQIVLASMAVIFPVLSHRLESKIPGGIHNSNFASFGRSLFPWLGVSENKAVIRNLSLTLADTAESTAEAKPLDSVAKVVLNSKITFDYLFQLSQEVFVPWPSTTCCTWIDTSRELTPLNKPVGLKK